MPGHVVVIGGSISGLLAAAAASPYCDQVTIVERDHLPDGPTPRDGAPQGHQVHVLLPLGFERMCALLPGLRQGFLDAGSLIYDQAADVPEYTSAGWRVLVPSTDSIAFRRIVLEHVLRQQVLGLPNVRIVRNSAQNLVLSENRETVEGIRLRDGARLTADLVVDCSGRRSRVESWLTEAGFPAPERMTAYAFTGYATQFVRVPPGALDGFKGVVAFPTPEHLYGAVLLPGDNGIHQLTALGMMRNFPPRDPDGFLNFIDKARSPILGKIARQCVPVGDIKVYHQPGNLRRRWESASLPRRLLVLGDAAGSMNPLYAQGMTLAALGADHLRRSLDEGTGWDDLPRAVQVPFGGMIEAAFTMCAAVDSSFPGAEVDNYTPPSAEEAELGIAVEELSTLDATVAAQFVEAAFWIRPEALQTAELDDKITAWREGRSPAPPAWVTDPSRMPGVAEAVIAATTTAVQEPRHQAEDLDVDQGETIAVRFRVDGTYISAAARAGDTLMEVAVEAGVPGIIAECGGGGACGTCHVYVSADHADVIGPPSDLEDDMLDGVLAPRLPTSRLACQIDLTRPLDGIEVAVPQEPR